MTTPYTYLIGWSALDRWYYGVRFADGCNPSDLWKKYFTSSEVVSEHRSRYGEPDVVEVRRVFSSIEKARWWEHRVLKRLRVISNDRWLNRSFGKTPNNRGTVQVRDANGLVFRVRCDDPRIGSELQYSSTSMKRSTETRRRIGLSKKGRRPWNFIDGQSRARKGPAVWSQEERHARSERGRIVMQLRTSCPICGHSDHPSRISRWHGANCRNRRAINTNQSKGGA